MSSEKFEASDDFNWFINYNRVQLTLITVKSMVISLVLETFNIRLLLLHQFTNSAISVRYDESSLMASRPLNVVSSANSTMTFEGDEETQSLVNKAYNSGERPHPWGVPVLITICSK